MGGVLHSSMTRVGITTAVAVAVVLSAGCGQPSTLPPIDLLNDLSRAERRAPPPSDRSIRADFVHVRSDVAPALLMTAPARVLYPVRMPARARFVADVGLVDPVPETAGVVVRVGLSDGRRYEEVFRAVLDHASHGRTPWAQVAIDLSAYSGWQFSVFYQPSRRDWQLVLNADSAPGGTVAWVRPTIEMP